MRPSIYSLLLATLVATAAHAQQNAPYPRRALSNKLQRRQLLSGVPDLLDDTINTLGVILGLNDPTSHSESPSSPPVTRSAAETTSPSRSSFRPSTSTSSPITSASTTASDSSTSSDSSFTKSSSSSTTSFSSFPSETTAAPTKSRGHGNPLSSSSLSTSSSLGITSVLPATSVSNSDEPTSVHTAPTSRPTTSVADTTSDVESSSTQSSLSSTLTTSDTRSSSAESSTRTSSDSTQTTSDSTSTTQAPTSTQEQGPPFFPSIFSDITSAAGSIFHPHPHPSKTTSEPASTTSDTLTTTSQVPTDSRGPHNSDHPSKTSTDTVPTTSDTSTTTGQAPTDTRGPHHSDHPSKTSSDTVPTTSDASTTTSDTSTTTPGNLFSTILSILDPFPPHSTTTSEPASTPSDTLTTTSQTPTDTRGPHHDHPSKTSSDIVPTTSDASTTTSEAPTSTSSTQNPVLSIISSIFLPPHPTSDASSTTSSTSPLSSIVSQVSSILNPPPETSTATSQASTSTQDSLSFTITSSQSHPGHPHSTITTEAPSSIPTSVSEGPTVVPPSSQSSAAPSQPISSGSSFIPASSVSSSQPLSSSSSGSGLVISFPSPLSSTASGSSSAGGEVTPAHTHTSTVPVNSELSFVLSVSSLVVASVPTTASSLTLTNPDVATTTLPEVSESGPTPVTTLSIAPLPTGIPGRILPPNQLDLSQDLSQYTLISILFNEQLNWAFVVGNQVSSSQIFAWLPVIIATALGISGDQVKQYMLQVYIPASYHSAMDQAQLGTTWLGYIPTNLVDTLAAMIKNKNSAFYNGVSNPVAQALANTVNPGFSLNAVSGPDVTGSPGGPNSGSSGATSDSGKTRRDAIIGVVSALGGIALLVLAFLLYRSWKRRRELAHRRISDPPNEEYVGVRPEGRDFDQDSVGGQRRRSFYYAEDSLRGFQQQSPAGESSNLSASPQQSMVQRRNLSSNVISHPVLRESSMNW